MDYYTRMSEVQKMIDKAAKDSRNKNLEVSIPLLIIESRRRFGVGEKAIRNILNDMEKNNIVKVKGDVFISAFHHEQNQANSY